MGDCVRELTPIEMTKSDLIDFLNKAGLIPSQEAKKGIDEIFAKGQAYEYDYTARRLNMVSEEAIRLREENKLMKTQLKVLTKYIEGHDI